jgi:hypothetical protein
MILACHVLRSSAGLAKMQVTGYGQGFRHLHGFAEVGVVWQDLEERVLMALR